LAPVTAQSVSMQQTFGSFVMHWGVPVPVSQTRLPVGQAHEPPGIEQTSPATALQSPSVQQAAFGMQLSEAPHSLLPAGQTQAPATHMVPASTAQSPSVQQAAFGMQLFEAGQTFWPAPQPQAPPGPEHV
jgi:hypothetical protein